MDIILNSDGVHSNWVKYIIDEFEPEEWIKNGNVLSFEFKEFQIDLIYTKPEEYQTSINYFAWNDLGNLMGRLSQSIGYKLGHTGLSYTWKDGTYHFRTEVICTDWEVICDFLGLHYDIYEKGFDTLEDIFKFVVSSPLFNKDIYLLENRNNYARTRDRKRPTYNAFLKWIETYEITCEQIGNGEKSEWLNWGFETIPDFKETYERVQQEWKDEIEYKKCFNVDLVREWTGLENQELGKFMKYLKEHGGMAKLFVLANTHLVEHVVKDYFITWKEDNGN